MLFYYESTTVFLFENVNQQPQFICDLQELENSDFTFFAKNTNIMNDDFSNSLNPFISKYLLNGIKPFYHLSLKYNTISKSNKFRFIIVKFNRDIVFVPYKIIQIIKTKQIRFFYFPISINSNKDNSDKVFDILIKKNFVSFVVTESELNDIEIRRNYLSIKRLFEYDDYFYQLDNKQHYLTGKYRSKNYINKLLNSQNVKIQFQDICDTKTTNDIFDLRNIWANGMEERGSVISKDSDSLFNFFCRSNDTNIKKILIYFNGTLISLKVFLCDFERCYADCIYIHHFWESDNDEQHKILQNITEIQKWLSWKYLYQDNGIKTVYLAGCRQSEHRLLKHKERICDSKIQYSIIKNNNSYGI